MFPRRKARDNRPSIIGMMPIDAIKIQMWLQWDVNMNHTLDFCREHCGQYMVRVSLYAGCHYCSTHIERQSPQICQNLVLFPVSWISSSQDRSILHVYGVKIIVWAHLLKPRILLPHYYLARATTYWVSLHFRYLCNVKRDSRPLIILENILHEQSIPLNYIFEKSSLTSATTAEFRFSWECLNSCFGPISIQLIRESEIYAFGQSETRIASVAASSQPHGFRLGICRWVPLEIWKIDQGLTNSASTTRIALGIIGAVWCKVMVGRVTLELRSLSFLLFLVATEVIESGY
jgi:hypothetical protein